MINCRGYYTGILQGVLTSVEEIAFVVLCDRPTDHAMATDNCNGDGVGGSGIGLFGRW